MDLKGSRLDLSRLLTGAVLIVLGALFLLEQFGRLDVANLWRWWPLILMVVGLGQMLQPPPHAGRGTGAVLLLVGAVLLLFNLKLVDFDLWQLWPLVLVIIGASLLRGGLRGRGRPAAGRSPAELPAGPPTGPAAGGAPSLDGERRRGPRAPDDPERPDDQGRTA